MPAGPVRGRRGDYLLAANVYRRQLLRRRHSQGWNHDPGHVRRSDVRGILHATGFLFLAPILSIGTCLAVGFVLCSYFIGFNVGNWFAFAMVALASAFILYDTSNVLHHYRTDQYVAASLSLFASVASCFGTFCKSSCREAETNLGLK